MTPGVEQVPGNVVRLTSALPEPPVARPSALRPRDTGVAPVEPWDFGRPAKMPREQLRLVQLSLDTFARRLTTLLTSGLRQVCQVEVVAVEQLPYDDYVGELGSSTLMAPIALEPLAGTTLLQFPVAFGLLCVDHLLGGPGGEQPPRLPTDVETALLRQLVEQMLGVLRYALEPVVSVAPALGTIEYNPQFVQAAGPGDPMLVARLRVTVGDEDHEASLCLPVLPLVGVLSAAPAGGHADPAKLAAREIATSRLVDTLTTAPVPVAVGFTPVRLAPTDVLGLRVGDVLPLGHAVTDPLHVAVDGVTLGSALAGRAGDRLAALVVAPPEDLP